MEIWKQVELNSNYIVSNLGRVKNIKTTNFVTGSLDGWNYRQVKLCKDGKVKYMYLHRLVALAFIPNPLNKLEVNHIDGDKTNNKVENLEWATSSENNYHAIKLKLKVLHGRSKVPVYGYVDNVLVYSFKSVKEAIETTGLTSIPDCIHNRRKSCGYINSKPIIWSKHSFGKES